MTVLDELLGDQRTLLAPMEGVTQAPFRELLAEPGGLGMVCTEFVRVSRAPLSRKNLRAAVQKCGIPLSVQVMGNEADKMAEAAAYVESHGADVVDINLGCPTPRAVRRGVGAAMLRDRDLLRRVIASMRTSVRRTLSAKIRAGFDRAEDALAIATLLEEEGVDFIAVHPRRRVDFYQGTADWRIIKTLKEALSIPVIGNGDVWYAHDALRMQEETGCDAVMIGRPAIRNPWIFAQIESLRVGEEPLRIDGAMLFEWLEAALPRVIDGRIGKLKEQVGYLCRAIPDEGATRKAALRSPDEASLMNVMREALIGRPASELDLGARGELGLERSGSAILQAAESDPERAAS